MSIAVDIWIYPSQKHFHTALVFSAGQKKTQKPRLFSGEVSFRANYCLLSLLLQTARSLYEKEATKLKNVRFIPAVEPSRRKQLVSSVSTSCALDWAGVIDWAFLGRSAANLCLYRFPTWRLRSIPSMCPIGLWTYLEPLALLCGCASENSHRSWGSGSCLTWAGAKACWLIGSASSKWGQTKCTLMGCSAGVLHPALLLWDVHYTEEEENDTVLLWQHALGICLRRRK